MDFGHGFDFEFLVLGDHNLLEGKEVVTEQDLGEYFGISFRFHTFDDALL